MREGTLLTDFAAVLIFLLVAIAFVALATGAASLLRHANPSEEKALSYECGERPTGTAWVQFNLRFFLIALVFIVFAVELVCIYPCAVVFRAWVAEGRGMLAVAEIFLFVGVLVLGLVYVWAKGDLEWIKSARAQDAAARRAAAPRAPGGIAPAAAEGGKRR